MVLFKIHTKVLITADSRSIKQGMICPYFRRIDSETEMPENELKGMKLGLVGSITDSEILRIFDSRDRIIVSHEVHELKRAWKEPFGGLV